MLALAGEVFVKGQSKGVENERRTDPTNILHPSHPPGRRSQSTRLMRLRRRGVWLSLLAHSRLL